eukprot:TRINITY_DN561_c0_g4_i1.p1 TRINITY_DN561_c0_g4~~TRINITY_DN561_c0_g4_i1.p1  ORF type:complete len:114 (-),score=18.17 TRINITY_DN561_c0_g4_i1:77-418(-)
MKAVLFVAIFAIFFSAASAQSALTCPLCEFAVKYIEGYIAENATLAEIEQSLDQVCQAAPSFLVQECQDFVNTEVPSLVNYIITTESPETACTQLGLCSSFFGVKVPKTFTKH